MVDLNYRIVYLIFAKQSARYSRVRSVAYLDLGFKIAPDCYIFT